MLMASKRKRSLKAGAPNQVRLRVVPHRLRPDIRLLENGDIDGAANEKNRLEEKQREARKARKKGKEDWKPR